MELAKNELSLIRIALINAKFELPNLNKASGYNYTDKEITEVLAKVSMEEATLKQ